MEEHATPDAESDGADSLPGDEAGIEGLGILTVQDCCIKCF